MKQTIKEELLKLPVSVLVEDLLYYKQDHESLLYIAKELEMLNINIDKPLHLWLVDFVKEKIKDE
uniref:Uncharacterized protein n=1 Tax=Vibrio phage P018-4 TaxID=3229728 RepID=A0AB39AJH5_9CAUD